VERGLPARFGVAGTERVGPPPHPSVFPTLKRPRRPQSGRGTHRTRSRRRRLHRASL